MAIKHLKSIKFPGLPDTYTIPQVDPVPTQDSSNAVSSGGVYDALQIEEHQILPTWIAGGLINKETGEFTESSDTNWTYTQFCEIPRSSKIRLSVYASGKAAGVAFYDSDETFISGTSVTSKANTDLREYDVPSNAVFARFTNVIGSNYHPDTPLIILLSDKTDAIFDEIIAKIPQVDAAPTQNSANAVRSGAVWDVIDELRNGEYVLRSGTLLVGFYPLANGTIGTNNSARMVVFPIKEDKTYYVTWLDGTNQYRTAFGDTAPGDIALGTPIYDYVDNRQTSHERYPAKNSTYKFLYVYIGTSSSATLDAVEVSSDIFSFKNCLASDGDQW